MVATLPTTGKGNWTNFDDYWRDEDVTWLQDRIILRYTNDTERNNDLGAVANGQVVYNSTLGILQLRHAGAWKNYAGLPSNLTTYVDTTSAAGIGHLTAGNKGITFTPTQVQITLDLVVLGGVLGATAAGATIKTGNATAQLSTSATHLLSDTPVSAPSLTLTGTGVVLNAANKSVTLGATTVASLNSTGAITATGAVNAASGTIGNVQFINNEVIVPVNQGMRSGQGWFYGGSNSAVMRQTEDGIAGSPNYLQVTSGGINAAGNSGVFNIYPQMRIYEGKPIQWYDGNNTFRGNISPVIYSTGDPGAANYPDGTLWIS